MTSVTQTSASTSQTSYVVTRQHDVYLTLINLGCVYFLINVSLSGLETLQSTVNAQQGLGTTSIGVLYASLIASSLLLGPTVIDRLRAKKTLYMFWTANAVFAVANAFPRWETLVPASALVGVTMASGNIVYGLYVTALAEELDPPPSDDSTSKRDNSVSGRRRQQNAVVRVNSVLLAFLNTGSVVGSLTGSLIIGSGQLPNAFFAVNEVDNTTVDISVCGAGHCPYIEEHIQAFASPDPHLVFVVGAVFVLCVIAAIALTCVLRPLPSDRPCCRRGHEFVGEATQRRGAVSVLRRIAGTLRLLANIRLLLLIPTIFMMGVITSFAIGAFNQSFVGCSLGIGMIGYAMIGYRLSYVGSSLLTGQLVRCLHRRTIVAVAMLTNVAVVGSWFAWTPPPPGATVGVQVAALMIVWCILNGVVIGVLRAVIYSLFPLLFATSFDDVLAQAAVWDSLGTSVAYFANRQFCFDVKASAVIAFTVFALVTYGGLEYVVARDGRRLRQHGSLPSREAATATTTSPTTTQLVANVVLDPSLIKNNNAKPTTCVSLLVDEQQITVLPSNASRE